MTPSEFSVAIEQPDVYLLDVRPKEAYDESHIKGAHNLDVTDPDFASKALKSLPKSGKIAVYCQTGKHSAIAKEELEKLGFNVLNLDNGLNSWIADQLPVVN